MKLGSLQSSLLSCLIVTFSAMALFPSYGQAQTTEQILRQLDPDRFDPDDAGFWHLIPVDSEFRRKFTTLVTLLNDERPLDAATAFQSLLDHNADYVVDLTNQTQSLRAELFIWAENQPKDFLEAYEIQFNSKAKFLIEAYDKTREIAYLEEAVRRYFLTSSGGEAAFQLAVRLFDRGETLGAFRLFERILDSKLHRNVFHPWLAVYESICLARMGQLEEALLRARAGVDQGMVQLGKRAVSWNEFAKLLEAESQYVSSNRIAEKSSSSWKNFYRNPERVSAASNFSVIPYKRWSVDMAEVFLAEGSTIRREMEQILSAESDLVAHPQYSRLPAWNPISNGGRIFISGLGQVAALEQHTGDVLWRSSSRDRSLEVLFNEDLAGYYDVINMLREQNPGLKTLDEPRLFALQQLGWDLTSGTLTADSSRVFAIRGNGLNTSHPRAEVLVDGDVHPLVPSDTNTLTAYDQATGKILWETLGFKGNGQGDILTGSFFLGPPISLEGSLYCLIENGVQIFLTELNPETGELIWSQPLSQPEYSIKTDRARRNSGTSPTWANPYLICPTNSGTVVAVDAKLHEIHWLYRYHKPDNENDPISPFPQNRRFRSPRSNYDKINYYETGKTWEDTLCQVVDDLVLVSPLDYPDLIAIDLRTGEPRWTTPRTNGMIVQVAPSGEILIVGQKEVRSISKADGNILWVQRLNPTAPPAGRGIFQNDRYLLPLKNGELISIKVSDGALLAATIVSSEERLGNLIAVDDQMFSTQGTTVTSFASQKELDKLLAQPSEQIPEEVRWSLLGQRKLHEGDIEAGLECLQTSYSIERMPEVARMISQAILNADPSQLKLDDELIAKLAELMVSGEHPPEFTFRYLDTLKEVGRIEEAYRAVKVLLDNSKLREEAVPQQDERIVHVTQMAAGFVSDAYDQATDEQKLSIERQALEILEASHPLDAFRHYGPLFAFKDFYTKYLLAFSRRLIPEEEPLLLERTLLQLNEQGPEEIKPEITARLADLLLQYEDSLAAQPYLDALLLKYGSKPCLNQRTGRDLLAEWSKAGVLRDKADPAMLLRDQYKYQIKVDPEAVSGGRIKHREAVPFHNNGYSAWDHWRFELIKTDQILGAFDEKDQLSWTMRFNEIRGTSTCQLFGWGHFGIFQADGELFLLSGFTNKQQLQIKPNWSIPYGRSVDSTSRGFGPSPAQNVAGVSTLVVGWQETAGVMGRCYDGKLPIKDQERIMLLDGVKGTPSWELIRRQEEDSIICYDGQNCYLLDSLRQSYETLRGHDGKSLGRHELPRHDEIRGLYGQYAVLWDRIDLQKGRLLIHNLATDQLEWHLDLSGSVSITPLDEDHLVVLDAVGKKLIVLDPDADDPIKIEFKVDPLEGRQLFVMEDALRWYVHMSSRPKNVITQSLGLGAGQEVNGLVVAINKQEQKIDWKQELTQTRAITGQPAGLPFLMYGAKHRITRPDENGEQDFLTMSSLNILDKTNGKLITTLPENVAGTLVDFKADLIEKKFDLEFSSGKISLEAVLAP